MYFVFHAEIIKGYLLHTSDAVSTLNCAFDSPCFFTHGAQTFLLQKLKSSKLIHSMRIQACFVFEVAVFELCTPAKDVNFLGDCGSRTEMCVRVQKGGDSVGTL